MRIMHERTKSVNERLQITQPKEELQQNGQFTSFLTFHDWLEVNKRKSLASFSFSLSPEVTKIHK